MFEARIGRHTEGETHSVSTRTGAPTPVDGMREAVNFRSGGSSKCASVRATRPGTLFPPAGYSASHVPAWS